MSDDTVFTQEDVNRFVANEKRQYTATIEKLEKEREKLTGTLTEKEKEAVTHKDLAQQKLAELEAERELYLADLLNDVPEDKRPKFTEGMSAKEKITFIRNNKTLFGKEIKVIPEAPEVAKPQTPATDRKQEAGSEANKFGGYASAAELAEKNPRLYEEKFIKKH